MTNPLPKAWPDALEAAEQQAKESLESLELRKHEIRLRELFEIRGTLFDIVYERGPEVIGTVREKDLIDHYDRLIQEQIRKLAEIHGLEAKNEQEDQD